jgi:hypothetical protein
MWLFRINKKNPAKYLQEWIKDNIFTIQTTKQTFTNNQKTAAVYNRMDK